MASQIAIATPPAQTATPPPAAPTPPGSWRHPRLDEISRRQQASTFDEAKLKRVVYSAFALLLTFLLPSYLPFQSLFTSLVDPIVYIWTARILRLFLLWNGGIALRPLIKGPDVMEDIPLTPNQRSLLGLPPTSQPATPGTTFITPPRYAKSTPRSSSSRAAMAGSSPFGRSVSGSPISGSPLAGRGAGGSPYASSSANGSPYVRKAVGKRYSLGDSVFGTPKTGLEDSSSSLPASPSPSGGQRGVSVSLNNKWLYQKQKGSPGARYI